MADLIVFNIRNERYALDIEHVQRIIPVSALTTLPNAHPYVDGMMSYEDKVIKVVNFRRMVDVEDYESELRTLFIRLKGAHVAWVEALKDSIYNGVPFTKTTNPHMCELGKWIDSFTSYDENVSAVFKTLVDKHQILHLTGGDLLAIEQRQDAIDEYERIIPDIFSNTLGALENFIEHIDLVANSLQKLIIYSSKEGELFALKVDSIADIVHLSEPQYASEDVENKCEFVEFGGVLELDGALVNTIASIKIPK